MTFVEFLILTLAVFRLARLVIEDTITEPLRTWILSRWPGADVKYDEGDVVRGGTIRVGTDLYAAEPTKTGDKIAKLLSCYWCLSSWLAGLVVLFYWRWREVGFWLLLVAAVSGLASIIGILMHWNDED